MTPRRQSAKKEDASGSPKGGLVQFRADEELMADLTQVAERLHIPIGVLARLWVSERLERELSFDISSIEAWRQQRYKVIDEIVEEEFNPGPIQVLHLVPFQRLLEIPPERVRQLQGMLAPVERVDEFSGRINLDGYQTVKQFRSEDKLAGTVQVFSTGQIESVRELSADENKSIFADYVDEDLIRAVWSYSCALEALQVKLPIALFIGFRRMRGYTLKSQRFASPSAEIKYGAFELKGLTIKDWEDVLTIESAAQTIKKLLDKFANSAGIARSMSYSASGEWLGPRDGKGSHVRRTKMNTKTEVLELVGINREGQRVDLILHDAGENVLLGKVRAPYLEPTATTRFKCLVNQNEMAPGGKQRLEYKQQMKQPVSISVGKLKFNGFVTRVVEGFGAGSFDGVNIPQERTLMFDIEPGFRAPTPNICAECGMSLVTGEGINNPRRGTLCRRCFG
jgi:hypothetical protein